MNCKLCGHAFGDFMYKAVCGRCLDRLITVEIKERQRAPQVAVPVSAFAIDSKESDSHESATSE